MMRRKITIVGAGATGATAAHILAERDYADVVLTDIKEGLPQGKALDLNQMGPVLGFEPRIAGTNSYEETAGSDVVVITAGLPRSPGMSRDDLVTTNEKIVGSVTEQIVAQSPDCTIVILSNPLDAMCHVAKSVSGFPKERVFGQAGILDTAGSARSSPGRRAPPSATCRRSCWAATATRWSPSSPPRQSAASRSASSSPRRRSRRWSSAPRRAAAR
jgi:malate/lactate dehydrogenase